MPSATTFHSIRLGCMLYRSEIIPGLFDFFKDLKYLYTSQMFHSLIISSSLLEEKEGASSISPVIEDTTGSSFSIEYKIKERIPVFKRSDFLSCRSYTWSSSE